MCVLLFVIIFIISSRSVSIKALVFLAQVKEGPGKSLVWKSVQFLIFKPWKVLKNLIDYYWNSNCFVKGIFRKVLAKRQFKIQLSRNNLGEHKVLQNGFFRLSRSLKSKILATIMPPPKYMGFSKTDLLFWATWRLECTALQIRDSQRSIATNLQSFTAHIYYLMTIVTGDFSNNFFFIIFS